MILWGALCKIHGTLTLTPRDHGSSPGARRSWRFFGQNGRIRTTFPTRGFVPHALAPWCRSEDTGSGLSKHTSRLGFFFFFLRDKMRKHQRGNLIDTVPQHLSPPGQGLVARCCGTCDPKARRLQTPRILSRVPTAAGGPAPLGSAFGRVLPPSCPSSRPRWRGPGSPGRALRVHTHPPGTPGGCFSVCTLTPQVPADAVLRVHTHPPGLHGHCFFMCTLTCPRSRGRCFSVCTLTRQVPVDAASPCAHPPADVPCC